MLDGFQAILDLGYWAYLIIGVVSGVAVGALPGFTATMGIALLLPFSYTLGPTTALGMLAGLYVSSNFADAVPACLVNTPGTPASMATAFDGFPMTQQGRGQEALVASGFSALIGTLFGGISFLLIAPVLSRAALAFGPPEFFWAGVFALTIVGSISGKSLLKGLGAGLIGLLLATIGMSPTGTVTRYTFGFPMMRGGLELVGVLIGIFAIPQVIDMVGGSRTKPEISRFKNRRGVNLRVIRELLAHPIGLLRSSAIGTAIGIVPGVGGPVATLVSYNEAVRWSKDKSKFGKGDIRGVVASEAAGNAVIGGALVPLVGLGIPGSGPTAVMMGAFLMLGLQPGPFLFQRDPTLVYSIGWSVIAAGVVTFLLALVAAKTFTRIAAVPISVLAPLIVFLCVVGAFATRSLMMDVTFTVGIGVAVYYLSKLGFHPAPIGLGVILGPIIEPAMLQSVAISRASSIVDVFLMRPVSAVLIVLTIGSAAWAVATARKDGRAEKTETHDDKG